MTARGFLTGLVLTALLAGAAHAQTEPPATDPANEAPLTLDASAADRQTRLDRLFDRLASAKTSEDAKRYEVSIDEIWSHSGSDTADLLTVRAVELVAGEDQTGALKLLAAALEVKPDYAEGWNKRATLFFLKGDYPSAMVAIRETLRHEPRHYGAWAGLGRILQRTGDDRRALDAYRRALAIHPHLDGLRDEVNGLTQKVRGDTL